MASIKYLKGVRSDYRIGPTVITDLILDDSSGNAKARNKVRIGYSHDVRVGAFTVRDKMRADLCVRRVLGDRVEVGHADDLYT